MPFRWEVTHDSATGDILTTEFHMGAPVGHESATAPLVRWPVANNTIGSATYSAPSTGVPVAPGNYALNNAAVDGLTTSWSATLTKELSATSVTSVALTVEKKVLGVWIEFPALSEENIHFIDNFDDGGDYYFKVVLNGPSGVFLCTEMYFSTAEGSTAPFVLHPVAAPKCNGLALTKTGTSGSDVLTGTAGPDVIAGLGGNDKITGNSGNDVICGGDGNDTIDAGGGNDKVDAGNGTTNTVDGGSGNDTLTGGTGADTLNGGSNDDTLDGAGGADKLSGGSDKDKLTGNTGSPDSCDGGSGTDSGGSGCETRKSIP
jgi:Ca2+-binding RTX toxin-like protein